MNNQRYRNFVRPSSTETVRNISKQISGEEAKKLYLHEIENNSDIKYSGVNVKSNVNICKNKRKFVDVDLSNLNLFKIVQNNNVESLRHILDACPDKIRSVDEYGWSLLMIACQANSVDAVKELLSRGIDTSIRDIAGNSAQTLVIRNRNFILADILLNHLKSSNENKTATTKLIYKKKVKEKYVCRLCDGKLFDNKKEHLSSTVHNINASKGRKCPTNYVIPESNKGYQIMLRVGWDKETGLGPDGSGKKYPLKTVQKYDKKGLGHGKNKNLECSYDIEFKKTFDKKLLKSQCEKNRRMEIDFRRQFY